jgi:hypothetical protein
MVSAVPLNSGGASCETRVENCGESGTTDKPQIKMTGRNKIRGQLKIKGEMKQQTPEM